MNPRYELELFIGRLCSLTDRLEASEILSRINALRQELLGGGWNGTDSAEIAPEHKKKIPESGINRVGGSGTSSKGEMEAERFFKAFKSGGVPSITGAAQSTVAAPQESTANTASR